MKWIVSQVGARQHYATPRAFERRGELKAFYTEAWAGRARGLLQKMPGPIRAMGERFSKDVPNEKVFAPNLRSAWDRLTVRWRIRPGSISASNLEWVREGRQFARWVNRRLDRRPPDPATDAFYGCKTACLETLQLLKGRGLFTLVDQADPAKVEQDLVRRERERWPGWEPATDDIPQEYFDRCAAEWDAADCVLVYSDWTRDAIIEQGVRAEKVVSIPLAFEQPPVAIGPDRKPGDRLTVLWLGTVILRKGIPYLIEAARKLLDRPIDFVVAGGIQISERAVASAPPNVKFIGRVLRADADRVYQSADLFVLPTISDSFALTQVEAMARGLPVIATTRCGKVVTDGVDGRIIPPGDADALAAAIASFDDDRSLVQQMSAAARIKAATFTLDRYGKQVYDAVVQRRPDLGDPSRDS